LNDTLPAVNELSQMILNGESEVLDFKQTISSAHKIAKTMVSFANHKGGRLLVGVKDNKAIAGVQSEDEKYMLELAAAFYCRPEIEISIKEWEVGDKTVIEAEIPAGKDKPYYAKDEEGKWWVYIRVKDKSLLASKTVVDVLRRQYGDDSTLISYSSNERTLLAYLEKHERITLKEYSKLVNISRWRARKILVNLISIGVLRVHSHEQTEFYTLS
jgi:predicted HTH transcriptional regulator